MNSIESLRQVAEAITQPPLQHQILHVVQRIAQGDLPFGSEQILNGQLPPDLSFSAGALVALRSVYSDVEKIARRIPEDAIHESERNFRLFNNFLKDVLKLWQPVDEETVILVSPKNGAVSSQLLCRPGEENRWVQPIMDSADLSSRTENPRRMIFALMDILDVHKPLIFLQVALTDGAPHNIQQIVRVEDKVRGAPDTATFYAIDTKGMTGIPLGKDLILYAAQYVAKNFPEIKNFVTLSPVPGFRQWLQDEATQETLLEQGASRYFEHNLETIRSHSLQAPTFEALKRTSTFDDLTRLAAFYTVSSRKDDFRTRVIDGVGHFHLGNGAEAYRLNPAADISERGYSASFCFMMNYRYRPEALSSNSENYRQGIYARSSLVTDVITNVRPLAAIVESQKLGL